MCWFCADTPISIQPQHGNMLVCESTVAQEEQVSFLRKKKKKPSLRFTARICSYALPPHLLCYNSTLFI